MSVDEVEVECLMRDRRVVTKAHVGMRISRVIQGMDLPLGYSCGGRGACLACLVSVSGKVTPPGPKEKALLNGMEPAEHWQPRLSCLTRLQGPVKIKTSYW